jgi:hypothetical protein
MMEGYVCCGNYFYAGQFNVLNNVLTHFVCSVPCINSGFVKKKKTNKCAYDCILTTPTCFGRLLRPYSGNTVSKCTINSSCGESV